MSKVELCIKIEIIEPHGASWIPLGVRILAGFYAHGTENWNDFGVIPNLWNYPSKTLHLFRLCYKQSINWFCCKSWLRMCGIL